MKETGDRYNTTEGLIPPPAALVPHAVYTRRHLDLLTVIGQLKKLFLPLQEIRTRLERLSMEEVASLAEKTNEDVTPVAAIAKDA